MASYKIEWKHSARKELKRLDRSVVARILTTVEGLAQDPFLRGNKKLAGTEDTYRVRVGDYRVIYSIKTAVLTIEIVRIGHRRTVYRRLV